jgi:hypothetical protein
MAKSNIFQCSFDNYKQQIQISTLLLLPATEICTTKPLRKVGTNHIIAKLVSQTILIQNWS